MRHGKNRRIGQWMTQIQPILTAIIHRFDHLWSGDDRHELVVKVIKQESVALVRWYNQFVSPLAMAAMVAYDVMSSTSDEVAEESMLFNLTDDYDTDNFYLDHVCTRGAALLSRIDEPKYFRTWVSHEEACRTCTEATAAALLSQLLGLILMVHGRRAAVPFTVHAAISAAEYYIRPSVVDVVRSTTLKKDAKWFAILRQELADI